MRKSAIYGIIAAAIVAASVGVAFAATMNNMSNSNTTEPAAQQQSSNQVRVIKHAMGETTITGTPERVVILELNSVELLYRLGVQPAGLGSMDFWLDATPDIMADWQATVDVGANFEPNLEAIAQLGPDLIIGMQSAHSEMYDDLNSIAPTLLLNNYPPEDGPTMFEAAKESTMIVADALNRHDAGVDLVEELEAKIAKNAARIESAGLKGDRFIVAETAVFDSQPSLTLIVPSSQNSQMLEMMGLVNAVPAPDEFQNFGDIDSSLEALASLDGPNVHFIYKAIPGTPDPLADSRYWMNNPGWTNLSFVKEGRVHNVQSSDYMSFYGGLIDLAKVSDRITDALTR
jgi:ABC-type Fe3+-hydroxamate transport system substrate-binding protein